MRAGSAARIFLVLGALGHHRLGGEHQRGHARRVLEREARHLGRVDHAGLQQVLVLARLRVEAERALTLADLVDDDRAFPAAVLDDPAQRPLEGGWPATIERMRGMYEYRKRRFAARAGKIEDDGYEDRSLAYQQMVQSVLAAQRDSLVRLRDEREISNEVMNRVIRELDLEESRLEI